jgi:hypothetical protein
VSRIYSPYTTPIARQLLDQIADKTLPVEAYKAAMLNLGKYLGEQIVQETQRDQQFYLASTVEDADFLAEGMLRLLEQDGRSIGFACFWNDRTAPLGLEYLVSAPILKKYQEPATHVDVLIIAKSIISGACVVRTNLEHLIQEIQPSKILIVAPVMYHEAQAALKDAFEPSISQKFQFLAFAQDDERTPAGEVTPGIGGMIYERLGFAGQSDKNQYVPDLVKSRRAQFLCSGTRS